MPKKPLFCFFFLLKFQIYFDFSFIFQNFYFDFSLIFQKIYFDFSFISQNFYLDFRLICQKIYFDFSFIFQNFYFDFSIQNCFLSNSKLQNLLWLFLYIPEFLLRLFHTKVLTYSDLSRKKIQICSKLQNLIRLFLYIPEFLRRHFLYTFEILPLF